MPTDEMGEESKGRRLAAVLAADIAGYTKLVEKDTQGTVDAWMRARAGTIDPSIEGHAGRIVKHTGDGFLAEFTSAQSAVECAIEMQKGLETCPLDFRMGISLGDVIDDGKDIHGEGVNLAARIEALAEPGSICISAIVHEAVRNRIETSYHDLGEHELKHVSVPVRVFRIDVIERPTEPSVAATKLTLPDRPSIAVLPFDNMSADPEQEYFADGIAEDLITELSKNKWLFVIARNSSFTYKGRAVDIKQVGQELGVRYVLEGSVRRAGNRVRITGQLIDAVTGAHLWANRIDGDATDIFDLQDQVTQSVVGAIAPRLELAEIERVKRKPTDSLDAYDHYLRGMAVFHQFTREANAEALEHFRAAFAIDPDYAAAYGMAARTLAQRQGFGWAKDQASESAEAKQLARTAASLGPDDAIALAAAGFALVVFGELTDSRVFLDRALAANPNLAWAWHMSGFANAMSGATERAIDDATRAMRLSPQDPQVFAMQIVVAVSHYVCAEDDEAFAWANAALRDRQNFVFAVAVVAASAAMSGRSEDASTAMIRLRELAPDLRLSGLSDWLRFERPEHFERWSEGLRRAGLPE